MQVNKSVGSDGNTFSGSGTAETTTSPYSVELENTSTISSPNFIPASASTPTPAATIPTQTFVEMHKESTGERWMVDFTENSDTCMGEEEGEGEGEREGEGEGEKGVSKLEEDMVVDCCRGNEFRKYGKRGNPHNRFLWLSDDFSKIYWQVC